MLERFRFILSYAIRRRESLCVFLRLSCIYKYSRCAQKAPHQPSALSDHCDKITQKRSISKAVEINLPRRTLQRHLALLVSQHQLLVEGETRNRRYRLAGPGDAELSAKKAPETKEGAQIPVSCEAQAVRRAVQKPIQSRKPVGYNRAFLDTYRPNESLYLTPNIREHLAAIGRSTEAERPAGTYVRQILSRLLIDLSWNSSRLEGNTYSLFETERLLEMGEAAEGKDAREGQMILNHKAAIEWLVDQAAEGRKPCLQVRLDRHQATRGRFALARSVGFPVCYQLGHGLLDGNGARMVASRCFKYKSTASVRV